MVGVSGMTGERLLPVRSEEHTSELQSQSNIVCRLLLEKKLILAIRTKGITQMVIEHDMKAIMRLSDRIVVLNSGEKLAEGTPKEIVENTQVIDAYLGAEE